MKRTTLLITLLTLLAMAACNPVEPVTPDIPDTPGTPDTPGEPTATVTYSDLTIDRFSYPAVPAEGGTVTPELQYSYVKTTTWSDGRKEDETVTDGAEVTFRCENAATDTEGRLTVQNNEDFSQKDYDVSVTVSVEGLEAVSSTVVYQMPRSLDDDEIVESVTVQLPITLMPHECVWPNNVKWRSGEFEKELVANDPVTGEKMDIYSEKQYTSYQANGRHPEEVLAKITNTRTWDGELTDYLDNMQKDHAKYEYVSAKGTSMVFRGGQLVRIDSYASGRKDTVMLKQPSYTVDVVFKRNGNLSSGAAEDKIGHYGNDTDYGVKIRERGIENTVEDPAQRPHSSVTGSVWTIDAVGADEYYNILHTLTATVDGQSTSISLGQSHNTVVNAVIYPCERVYTDFRFTGTDRDNYPEIEDYPPGSTPKWAKQTNGTEWMDPFHTKSLHADSERVIKLLPTQKSKELVNHERIYLSGAHREATFRDMPSEDLFLIESATIVAEGTVKLKDGTAKTITHTYEWYNRRVQSLYILIPVIENLAESFVWTITIKDIELAGTKPFIQCNEDDKSIWGYISDFASYKQLNNISQTFQFEERLSSINEWCKQVVFSGVIVANETDYGTSLYVDYGSMHGRQKTKTEQMLHPNIVDGETVTYGGAEING